MLRTSTGSTTDPAVVTVVGPHQRGPALLDVLHAWLPGTTVVVRPVLDLSRTDAVNAHDPPPVDGRPGPVPRPDTASSPAAAAAPADLRPRPHRALPATPDAGGPPGQTRPANLAPLCRCHHRAKTHGAWALPPPTTTAPTPGPHPPAAPTPSLPHHHGRADPCAADRDDAPSTAEPRCPSAHPPRAHSSACGRARRRCRAAPTPGRTAGGAFREVEIRQAAPGRVRRLGCRGHGV